MICFQFVLWRYLIQYWFTCIYKSDCCDLLSICSLTIFDTILCLTSATEFMLWFAFNLFFDDIWYNTEKNGLNHLEVVICFQFVLWRYLIQSGRREYQPLTVVICFQFVLWRYLIQCFIVKQSAVERCDLLSICSLTIFDTMKA